MLSYIILRVYNKCKTKDKGAGIKQMYCYITKLLFKNVFFLQPNAGVIQKWLKLHRILYYIVIVLTVFVVISLIGLELLVTEARTNQSSGLILSIIFSFIFICGKFNIIKNLNRKKNIT